MQTRLALDWSALPDETLFAATCTQSTGGVGGTATYTPAVAKATVSTKITSHTTGDERVSGSFVAREEPSNPRSGADFHRPVDGGSGNTTFGGGVWSADDPCNPGDVINDSEEDDDLDGEGRDLGHRHLLGYRPR